MMMAWGMFIFDLKTLPINELSRQTSWNHASNNRVGLRSGRQFLGQGDETIKLQGSLYPEITGGRVTVELARAMADLGSAWPLVDFGGKIYGLYVCDSFTDTSSLFFANGLARKIDFDMGLVRVGDDQLDLIGSLTGMIGIL